MLAQEPTVAEHGVAVHAEGERKEDMSVKET
jgi:hypothetical protein